MAFLLPTAVHERSELEVVSFEAGAAESTCSGRRNSNHPKTETSGRQETQSKRQRPRASRFAGSGHGTAGDIRLEHRQ